MAVNSGLDLGRSYSIPASYPAVADKKLWLILAAIVLILNSLMILGMNYS